MTKTNIPHGDVKFYYKIHCQRQKSKWLHPVAYETFYRRIRSWMNLHDAIYKERVEYQVREYPRYPIQDWIRRAKKLKDENIMLVDFEKIDKVLFNKREYKMAHYNMKPKKSLWEKFISLFK